MFGIDPVKMASDAIGINTIEDAIDQFGGDASTKETLRGFNNQYNEVKTGIDAWIEKIQKIVSDWLTGVLDFRDTTSRNFSNTLNNAIDQSAGAFRAVSSQFGLSEGVDTAIAEASKNAIKAIGGQRSIVERTETVDAAITQLHTDIKAAIEAELVQQYDSSMPRGKISEMADKMATTYSKSIGTNLRTNQQNAINGTALATSFQLDQTAFDEAKALLATNTPQAPNPDRAREQANAAAANNPAQHDENSAPQRGPQQTRFTVAAGVTPGGTP
jgi:hypothetical protein